MKTGEIFTLERFIMGGTGYQYAVVRLTGEVALLNIENTSMDHGKVGSPQLQRFTFQCLRPGKAEVQFARFRSFELGSVIYEDILPLDVEPAEIAHNRSSFGGWSDFKELEDADKKVFAEAMKGHIGVTYTPEKVSKQLVNGTNYRFFCYGKPVTQDSHSFPAIVTVHAPIGDRPTIANIERVVLE